MKKEKMRSILVSVAKLAFAVGLIGYLVYNGTLDFSELHVLIEKPQSILATFAVWLTASVCLGAIRWRLLLRGVGIDLPLGKVFRLHMIGFFFNLAMPGAVGGDLVKALYVIREQPGKSKTAAMLSIVMDRVVGLSSLFILAGIIFAASFAFVWEMENARGLMIFTFAVVTGLVGFLLTVLLPYQDDRDPLLRLFRLRVPGFGLLRKVYEALRQYRHQPSLLFSCIGLSLLIQFLCMSLMWYMTGLITDDFPPYTLVALVFPMGSVASALPISPGGFGVGHVAFQNLYNLVGLAGGANTYNAYLILNTTFNLLGVIPYLAYRARGKDAPLLDSEQREALAE